MSNSAPFKKYLEDNGIKVTRVEETPLPGGVFHVSPEDRAKAEAMKDKMESDLNAYAAFSGDFGMSVIIFEQEEDEEE